MEKLKPCPRCDAADALEAADKRIAELMPKEGEWIEANTRPRSAQFVCSVCHRTAYDIQPTRNKAWTKRCRYAYCPNCGAKMDAESEADADYQASVLMQEYFERYEPTYNSEDGSM